MAVIVIPNPKGGVGKTTTSLVLALSMAERGAKVTLIDQDKNRPLMEWKGAGERPIKVLEAPLDESFVRTLDAEAAGSDLVIVDLEGVASRAMSRAIARADLCLIPLQPSHLDARQAGRAVGLVREEEEVLRRTIPIVAVFTRTAADKKFRTRTQKTIISNMAKNRVPMLEAELAQREAFKALFEHGCTLRELAAHKVSGVPQAIENATRFADEIEAILRGAPQARAA